MRSILPLLASLSTVALANPHAARQDVEQQFAEIETAIARCTTEIKSNANRWIEQGNISSLDRRIQANGGPDTVGCLNEHFETETGQYSFFAATHQDSSENCQLWGDLEWTEKAGQHSTVIAKLSACCLADWSMDEELFDPNRCMPQS